MPTFALATTIKAPLSDTFTAFADIANAPKRMPSIKKVEVLTPGPIGVGTKFKETRIVFKREASETFEFTTFVPNKEYELVAQSCGAEYRVRFTFTEQGDQTRVDATFATKALSLFAKLMKPLAYLMIGPMKKCIIKDMDDLKKTLETPPPVEPLQPAQAA